MTESFSLPIQPFIARGSNGELEPVEDEIFIDLQDGAGTQHLAKTCYGVAVKECLRVGRDAYILKVRPDLRGLLFSELEKNYKTFRVYRPGGDPNRRVLLTDQLFLRFAAETTIEQRQSCLRRYWAGIEQEDDLPNGVYSLTGRFSEDPLFVRQALLLDVAILEVAHVVVAIPCSIDEASMVDLVATP